MQALDLLPLLTQTVEKAASQSTQVPVVTEGVAAALLLSKLSVTDSQAGKILETSRVVHDKGFFQSPWEKCFGFLDQLDSHRAVTCRDEPQGCSGEAAKGLCYCPWLCCSDALRCWLGVDAL